MASAKKSCLITICFLSVIGTLVAVTGVHLLKVKRGYTDFLDKVGSHEQIELKPAPIDPSWIISGSPICGSLVFAQSHDESSISGIWQCDGPAKFEWHYWVDETIYILEGAAEIEYLGKKFVLEAGSSTHFSSGTKAIWTVPKHVRKTFWIHDPGRMIKLIRRIIR